MLLKRKGIIEGIFLAAIFPVTVFCQTEYTLNTNLGQVKGLELTNGNNKLYQFRKIPYAQPPLGHLRFRKPEPYGSWKKVLNAKSFPPSCIQKVRVNGDMLKDQSEDCLFLNVYVPYNVSSANKKAVMIWIHGGGLIAGSSKSYDGTDLALAGDVIIVTINYRLNIFGFMSSGDSALPGNYGLWDQRLAIKWVKDNIADYGGNPSMITIFGESAGGWSASFQSISPLNEGLFQRAIIQSGTANSVSALLKKDNLTPFARKCGCFTNESTDKSKVVDCMRKKTLNDLFEAYNQTKLIQSTMVSIFGVAVDGEFLPDEPGKLLRNSSSASSRFFQSLDIIVGTTSAEGSLLLLFADELKINMTNGIKTKFLCDVIAPQLAKSFFDDISLVSEAICNKYKVSNGDTTKMAEQGRQVVNLYEDFFFVSPTVDILNIHSNKNSFTKTFQYLFNRDRFQLFPTPEWFLGAQHGSELTYLLGFSQYESRPNVSVSQEDRQLSKNMLKYWTNFAKTGNPNAGSSLPLWPSYDENTGKYITLDINLQNGTNLYEDRVQFWQNDIPNILNPLIQTKSGPIRGIAVQYPQGTVSHFRGIPYAKPPIGILRFAKPQAINTWTNVLEARAFPPSCVQDPPTPLLLSLLPNKEMSEDCLYLNIYVPDKISDTNKKSVMVWIHGGGYVVGQASLYDGSILAATGDVIVVTVNYRLGVFGFISSDDAVLRGNYGLWDQKLAIEWVKHNIASFGGDPSSITIFGESAGGFSVSLQSISPLNKGLFQRVIAQSGTAFTNMAVSDKPKDLTVLYANAVNCTNTSTPDILNCLRTKPPTVLHSVTAGVQQVYNTLYLLPPAYPDIMLKPTVDGELIPDTPSKLLGDSSSKSYKFFRSLDMIVGTTSAEGSLILSTIAALGINATKGMNSSILCDMIAPAMAYEQSNMASISQRICDMYRVDGSNNSELILQGRKIVDYFGDAFFVSGTVETLNLHSVQNSQSHSYQYLFSKQLPSSMEIIPLPDWFIGAGHASEIPYMFATFPIIARLLNISSLPEDIQLANNMATYWSNFAKTGDPNSQGLIKWPQFTNKEKDYIEFGSNAAIKGKKMLWSDRMKFWFGLRNIDYILAEPEKPIGGATIKQPIVLLLTMSFLWTLLQFFMS